MLRWFVSCARMALGACLGFAAAAAVAAPMAVSDAAREIASLVLAHANHRQRPFAVVDKRSAMLVVYHADGSLAGSTPVLLGRAAGDVSSPGVGQRTQRGALRPDDATTAAGRFESVPGRNHTGEAVVWIDHEAALAIHRLRPGPSERGRAQALTSPHTADRRVSAGCVVVPVVFYQAVVQPLLGSQRGVVYVLPEQRPWQEFWDDISRRRASSGAAAESPPPATSSAEGGA